MRKVIKLFRMKDRNTSISTPAGVTIAISPATSFYLMIPARSRITTEAQAIPNAAGI
jgi:hypothetical protein